MTTFSERLRRLRQAANLSQVQLAGDDLSPSYISLLESGKRQPSDDVAGLLAERLGCSVEDLLTPAGEERRKAAELNLEFARLSLRDDNPADAVGRLRALLDEEGLDKSLRDDASWELARALERILDVDAALEIALGLHERAVNGTTHLPLPTVAIYLVHLYQVSGDMNAAIRIGEDAVRLLKERRETTTRQFFRLMATLAAAYFGVGDFHLARAYLRDATQVAQRFADPQGEAALSWNAAIAAESLGRLDEALHLSRQALAILTEHAGGSLDVARLRGTAAFLVVRQDPSKVAEARALLDLAEPDLARMGAVDAAVHRVVMATVSLLEGDLEGAERIAREALLVLAAYPSEEQARAHLVLGDALGAQGRQAESVERYVAAVQSLEGQAGSRGTALLWREVAERFVGLGRLDDAIDGYRAALDAVAIRSTRVDEGVATEAARQRTAAFEAVRAADDATAGPTPGT